MSGSNGKSVKVLGQAVADLRKVQDDLRKIDLRTTRDPLRSTLKNSREAVDSAVLMTTAALRADGVKAK